VEAIPAKSIAVLPFENLSDDPENAYFADGVHDDILSSLAKISDLKVISRTSVRQYKEGARNLREIGQALGGRAYFGRHGATCRQSRAGERAADQRADRCAHLG
jgi:Predicted integral membrane protein